MRFFFTILFVCLGAAAASAQETSFVLPVSGAASASVQETNFAVSGSVNESTSAAVNEPEARFDSAAFVREFEKDISKASPITVPPSEHFGKTKDPVTDEPEPTSDSSEPAQQNGEEKFHWKPALKQSLIFLGVKHGFRLTESKTRRYLGGPFFRDWGRSVKGLHGWRDGDSATTNYIAHPMQGGLTGRIFVNNSDRAKKQEFGKSRQYWASRLKALAWSAAWGAQFELGPISEASIGNVGTFEQNGYGSMGYVDLVVTPVLGTALLVGEDAIDKYILKNWLERRGMSKMKIRILRSILTPTTSFGNLIRGKVPWKRDDRPIPD